MGLSATPWRKLPVSLTELCIELTLQCGQSFRWRKIEDEWRSTLHGRIVSLKQDADCLYYKAVFPDKRRPASPPTGLPRTGDCDGDAAADDTEALLRSYFNLQLDLGALYKQWSRDDANFRRKAVHAGGIRILNQDAWEALVCFICSSNNNIARISQMAHKLCLHYGPFLGTVDGEAYHDFPPPAALAAPAVEGHLRQLGFGYRAKYIAQTAQTLCAQRPPGWLLQLRNAACPPWPGVRADHQGEGDGEGDCEREGEPAVCTYEAAREQLLLFSGVGPKVADCVCLMGLGWGEAVPVDTHVWQIAVRDYKFKKSVTKTFSKAMYDAVGAHFRDLWGAQAGWAQSVLFTAKLKALSDQEGEPIGEPEGGPEGVSEGAKGEEGDATAVLPARSKRRRAAKAEADRAVRPARIGAKRTRPAK